MTRVSTRAHTSQLHYLSVYRVLLDVHRALLSVYRAFSHMHVDL